MSIEDQFGAQLGNRKHDLVLINYEVYLAFIRERENYVDICLIIPMSTTYSPIPIIGGRAIMNANPQIRWTHRDVQKVTLVTICQEGSFFNTDWHRIAAVVVKVYSELIPYKNEIS